MEDENLEDENLEDENLEDESLEDEPLEAGDPEEENLEGESLGDDEAIEDLEGEEALGDEDLAGDDADSDDEANEEDEESSTGDEEEEEAFETAVRVRQKYKMMAGRNTESKGFALGSADNEEKDEAYFINKHEIAIKLRTSPATSYFFRLETRVTAKDERLEDKYEDFYSFGMREAYVNYTSGSHALRAGGQILTLGKVDFDPVIDILNNKNQTAIDVMETEESKLPAPLVRYQWRGEYNTFSFLYSPFYQETDGQEYTRRQNASQESEEEEETKAVTYYRTQYGVQWQIAGDQIDFRAGLYDWYDRDAKLIWNDEKADSTNDSEDEEEDEETRIQSFKEYERDLQFGSLELDWNFDSFIWKADLGYFLNKTFYGFFKDGNEVTRIGTHRLKHLAIATSIEKKFEKVIGLETLYVIPAYSYRVIFDAPAYTQIMDFENERIVSEYERDIEKRQAGLMVLLEFTENFNTVLTYAQTKPYEKETVSNSWQWKPDGSGSIWELKMYRSRTPKQYMTKKPIKNSRYFLHYTYKY